VAEPSSSSNQGSSSSKAGSSNVGSSSSFFGQLLAYAAASYHLPLLIGFSVADHGDFVWGGAMLLRAAELQKAAAEDAAAAAAVGVGTGSDAKPNILQVGYCLFLQPPALLS
jgi:hypothetical protein